MGRYIVGRLIQAVISIFAVSIVVFFLGRLVGDPVDLLLEMGSTAQMRQDLIVELGLDKSYPEQFFRFITTILSGDLGHSVINGAPVAELVGNAFGNTVYLGATALAVAIAIAIPIGVLSAVRQNSVIDRGARIFAILGQSAPPFWIGIMLIMLFGVRLRWLPTSGIGGLNHVILPAVTLGWYLSAGVMRLTRTSMLEVMRSDFVRLARAKGVPESSVIWKHGFKNAALPVLTFTALLFVSLLSGTVVTETVFAWPGLGRLLVQSVTWRDFPVVEAVVLLLSALYLGVNIIVDLAYAYLNPKIRFGSD